ncbi:MAG: SH3 domain-containing protein [Bacillota bacterium]
MKTRAFLIPLITLIVLSLFLAAGCAKGSEKPRTPPANTADPGAKPDDTQQDASLTAPRTPGAHQTDDVGPEKEDDVIRLRPVDQSGKNPSFKAFRDKLLDAIARRDKDFILEIIHPDITVSFGGESGRDAFIKHWNLDEENSSLWDELGDILRLGGTFSADMKTFTAPYVFTLFPSQFDEFQYAAVTGDGVNIRAKPGLDAPVLGSVSYEIVRADPALVGPTITLDGREYGWVKVETLSGVKGYISAKYVRSPIAYRVSFEQVGDKWLMKYLVQGD